MFKNTEIQLPLRDTFAAISMHARVSIQHNTDVDAQEIAMHAYKIADAMLKARDDIGKE